MIELLLVAILVVAFGAAITYGVYYNLKADAALKADIAPKAEAAPPSLTIATSGERMGFDFSAMGGEDFDVEIMSHAGVGFWQLLIPALRFSFDQSGGVGFGGADFFLMLIIEEKI